MNFSDYIKQSGTLGTWIPTQVVGGVTVPGYYLVTWAVAPSGETGMVWYDEETGAPRFTFDSQDGLAIQGVAGEIFDALEGVANIKFVNVPFGTAADLTLVNATNINETNIWDPHEDFRGGLAGAPDGNNPGLVLLKHFENLSLSPGSVDKYTLIHEVGHALGLKHLHDAGESGGPIFPGLSDKEDPGAFGLNDVAYSAMSYNYADGVFPNTFMAADVAALITKYGASTHVDSVDVYGLSDAIGYNLIRDTGSTRDKIVNDLMLDATIDLRAATDLVEEGGGGYLSGFVSAGTGGSWGYLIASGTVIEDADGNGADDTIIGNQVANILHGFAGEDVFRGLGGNDTIDGGADFDKAFYSGNMADYGIAIVGNKIVLTDAVANRDGVDTLTDIERLFFADGTILTADLPKTPTSFQVSHSDVHTHAALLPTSSVGLHLINVVDPDGGSNVLEIVPEETDPAILPYLVASGTMIRFNQLLTAGTYDIGVRTYDVANNVRSETQVLSLEVHGNTAPTGATWTAGSTPTPGIINENFSGLVGYLQIVDANGSAFGGSGEHYSVRLIGDYSHTYSVQNNTISGPNQASFFVMVSDSGNVDYEVDSSPTLTLEITDIAGNVSVFNLDVTVLNTANTSFTAPSGQSGQVRTWTGSAQDNTFNGGASSARWTIDGGAGGDSLFGGQSNDTIDGGAGNDILKGNGGNDDLYALSGSDTVYGGSGNDTVHLYAGWRPEYVDNAYFDGNFLVIEEGDTIVRIYNDVEGIHLAVPWTGDLYYTRQQYYDAFAA